VDAARHERNSAEQKGGTVITFKQLLCAVDFSDTSARALTYAAAFAAWYKSQLTVLHVAPAFDEPLAAHEASRAPYPDSRDDIVARLRRSIEHVGATAVNARPLAQEGRASELIVNCGAAMKADLLVIGTHGLGGFHRLLLGSVAEKVVRTAPCPVLTVPPSAPATTIRPILFKKILCPIDYSPSSLRALEYALELGRQADGCVTVLSTLEYIDPEEPCEHVDSEVRGRRQRLIEHARERLHAQLAGEARTWCDIQEVVAINRAYKEVLQRAAAMDTDLIVMGAQGRSGAELMLSGSNTQHVVRAATCPVLTVRA
jgi:nucleotide-binding universal stress UspA family protein